MLWLNKIQHNNKLFQVFITQNKTRIILEIKNNTSYYYEYPEFNDLLEITKKYFTMNYIVYNTDKNNNTKTKFIKFTQKVLIAGIVISISLNLPVEVKTYTLNTIQNIYTEAFNLLPNYISSQEELNKEFNTYEITKDDVHKIIDENNNIKDYKNIIHEFVDDVYRIQPNHNWWIFYQNIKRMKIEAHNLKNCSSNFNLKNSKIEIDTSLDDEHLKIALRHELTHALSIIDIIVDNKKVVLCYFNFVSGYGRSIMEMLTSSFNSTTGKGEDFGYDRYKKLFQPLKIQLGEYKFTETLFTGNIDSFIEQCKPYYENIEEYISYVDAIFYCYNSGDWRNKLDTNEDFFMKFNIMSMEFFLTLQQNQLKNGIIPYEAYLYNKLNYINNLQNTINPLLEKYNYKQISISDQYKLLNELEEKIFDHDILKNLEKANNKSNVEIIIYNNNSNTDLAIKSIYNNNNLGFYRDIDNQDTINDFYFIIEKQKHSKDLKLRLININNSQYSRIDLLTNEYIDEDSEIIYNVSVLDYVQSIPEEKLKKNKLTTNEQAICFKGDYFQPNDILEYKENNENKQKSK